MVIRYLGMVIQYICVGCIQLDVFFMQALKWFAGTNWYWYYTIDPVGYQMWNLFLIADMVLFLYLFNATGLKRWMRD